MSFIGDIFHAIGGLFSPHTSQPQAPVINTPRTPAPQQQAQDKPNPAATGNNPSFLAAAALPNYGQNPATAGAPQSNPTGKSTLGS